MIYGCIYHNNVCIIYIHIWHVGLFLVAWFFHVGTFLLVKFGCWFNCLIMLVHMLLALPVNNNWLHVFFVCFNVLLVFMLLLFLFGL